MTRQRWAIRSPDFTNWATAPCPTWFDFWCDCVFHIKSWKYDHLFRDSKFRVLWNTAVLWVVYCNLFSWFFFETNYYTVFALWLACHQKWPTRDAGQVATSILSFSHSTPVTLFLQMWENNEKTDFTCCQKDTFISQDQARLNGFLNWRKAFLHTWKHEGTSIHVSPPGLTLLNYP